MKKVKTFCAMAAFTVCTLIGMAGCGSKKIEVEPIPSDTLFVEKVENLPEDFILGMDSSQVPALEAAGVKEPRGDDRLQKNREKRARAKKRLREAKKAAKAAAEQPESTNNEESQ